ncbi:MAG: peptide chain release factor 1 [Candidatus Bathyarchaeota archaeon B63]|nr:MAG: peptide chain release factor 1 [Candidatus Bathyarchaeota archaeon B63]
MVKRTSLERYRLKRMLEALASKEGRGTELISLYIPPGRQISEVVQMLKEEWGTASNIKSNTTRKNVQDAIVKVTQRLKLFKRVPDNGLVLFCGAIPQNGPGSEKIEGPYVIIPPEPINIYLYRCDSKFHLNYLMDLLKETETYGIILLDSSGATFATLTGRRLNIIQEITSGIPGKHRAGGQSARRFERLREMRLIEFFKRVGKHADEIFLQIPDLKGLILGGPGPTKTDFEKGRFLDYRLKEKIVAVVDTAYTGEQGVEEIFERAPEIIKNVRYVEEKRIVQRFLYEIGHDTGLATYGEADVRRALKSGLVETLLLSEELDKTRLRVECSSCGYSYSETMRRPEVKNLEHTISSAPCPKCQAASLQIKEKTEIIEDLAELAEASAANVEIISTETEEGQMLWKAFGGVAAILRYKLQG